MTSKSLLRTAAVALLICVFGLTACSESDQDAQAQLKQANENLEQAKKNLAEAKARAADAKAAQEKQAAQDEVSRAKEEEAEAEKKQSAARQTVDEGAEQAESNDQPVCSDCGTIKSITPIERNPEHGSGVGAVIGGVAGGVLGSQIGHGAGKTIAEIAGALGGAYAGNIAEKHIRNVTVYRVAVAMDAGGTRSVTIDTAEGISNGTRVRVIGNNLAPLR
ncbi:glycine zipper 2TM domain-containing protein [Salinisphaera sp.]|uniref:glycine zipper 2TM domain-containing protein n=1 Tax=Salinisphaera sp. TaxID=1914330 RepID=UPI002D789505|nr:glycine zipper 2TM domain-containing protein [Salinisphaera sp.]HET7313625.1 glycine zipper 2TM domain-containing protein [Salinisphaera sp.]